MKPSFAKTILFGIFIWATSFVGAMFIFPFHDSDRVLFETLMTVIFISSVILYSTLYFKRVTANYAKAGLSAGIVWLIVNLSIDLIIFSFGPLARPLPEYIKDIGLVYLTLPVITYGIGSIIKRKAA